MAHISRKRHFVVPTTITNHGDEALQGPVRLVITNITGTLTSQDGTSADGDPFLDISQSIAAGASRQVDLTFAYARTRISFDGVVQVYVEDSPPENIELAVLQDGEVGQEWAQNLNAFDAAIGYANCSNDGGAGCPSMNWKWVDDEDRGSVLEIEHATNNQLAGFFIASTDPVDISAFETGQLKFDIKVISGDANMTFKLDCFFPCTSGDYPLGEKGKEGWETISIDVADLKQRGLNLS